MLGGVPDLCTVTFLAPTGEPEDSGGPAFTTRFDAALPRGPLAEGDLRQLTGARLRLEPGPRPGRARLRFLVVGKARGPRPPPLWEIDFELAERAARDFWGVVESYKSFIWVLSTPEWEAQQAVSLPTGRIYARRLTYRDLH